MKTRLLSILMGIVLLVACASSPIDYTPEQQTRKDQEIEKLENFLEPSFSKEKAEKIASMISETYDLFMTQPVSEYGDNDRTRNLLDKANDIRKSYNLDIIGLEIRVQVNKRSCEKRLQYHIIFSDGNNLIVWFHLNSMQCIEPVCKEKPEISL